MPVARVEDAHQLPIAPAAEVGKGLVAASAGILADVHELLFLRCRTGRSTEGRQQGHRQEA